MLNFRLHPDADAEAVEAVVRIRDDDPQEAALFVLAIEDAILRARTQPTLYRRFEGEFRKVRMGKFRYALVYRISKDEIQVLAVMHLSLRPGYWKKRGRDWPE